MLIIKLLHYTNKQFCDSRQIARFNFLQTTLCLRSLAQEPPKENAQECLRIMGMALKNLASAMNNTQALEAAAIILESEPTPSAIAYRAEQLSMLPQAVSDIRAVLAKLGCSWQDYWDITQMPIFPPLMPFLSRKKLCTQPN